MATFKRNNDYWIDYYADGQRYREKIGPNKSTAIEVLNIRKGEIAKGTFKSPKQKKQDREQARVKEIRFKDFAHEYLELHCKVNNQKSWKKADVHNIKVLNEHFSGLPLHEISTHKVQQFKQQRAKEVTPATVNRQLTCLKSMFNKAISWGKFSGKNPVKGIKLFKENNQRLRFLEKEEIIKLLANCNEHIKPIVIIALNTGMRRGEIMGLKWRDIDFRRGIIHLYNTKNGEKREIPLNEQARNALISVRKHPESELVFTKKDGQSYGDFKKSFLKALDKSGIKEFRFHDLRHTFASHLVMNGVDLNTVRELLGHKSLAMTLRYSHLSPSHKKHAVDSLSRRMDTIWTPEAKPDEESEIRKLLSSLTHSKLEDNAGVAQLVEQLTCNQ